MSWERGSTRAWRTIRRAVIIRDHLAGWACRAHDDGWCERSSAATHTCARRMWHAHHTKGRKVTGDDPAHVVGACGPCNLAIGDPSRAADPPAAPVTDWGNRC